MVEIHSSHRSTIDHNVGLSALSGLPLMLPVPQVIKIIASTLLPNAPHKPLDLSLVIT